MSSRIGVAGVALLVAAVVAAPAPTGAQTVPAPNTPATRSVVSTRVAEQLGIKLSPGQAEELAVGTSVIGTLADPARLARFGLGDCHPGARVTASRLTVDRLRVEVDELEPVPVTRRVTLKLDDRGELTVAAPR